MGLSNFDEKDQDQRRKIERIIIERRQEVSVRLLVI